MESSLRPQVKPLEDTARPSPMTPAALAYAAACVIALTVLAHIEKPLEVFGVPHPGLLLAGKNPVAGLLWGLGLGAALAAVGQASTRWTSWGRRLQRLLGTLVGNLHPADALLLAALSALGEELVFRAILLPYAGLWVSSALFGVAHLVPRHGLWPWSLWAAGAGLLLGWAALATGGLVAPVLAHFAVNAVGLLTLARSPR